MQNFEIEVDAAYLNSEKCCCWAYSGNKTNQVVEAIAIFGAPVLVFNWAFPKHL